MRLAYVLTLGLVVITGCARSSEGRVTPTPTANRVVTAEAEPSATQTAPPTIRPVSALPSKDLLFQPGDLPAGVRAGTFSSRIPDWLQKDANHGWLALGATIWTTTDGGKHWRAQFQVDSPVKSITFVSSQHGWIETEKGYWLTTDSGSNWQHTQSKPDDGKMPPPATKPGPLNEAAYDFCADNTPFAGSFFALDKQTAWALCVSGAGDHYMEGVRLFQSKDGGKDWELVTDSPAYGPWGDQGLFFVDQQHGWVALSLMGVSATDDGGHTWRQILGLDTGSASRIQFLTPRQGFISVYNSGYNDARDTLLRTDDGGATWREIFDAPPPALFPSGPIQFFADGSGIGAGLEGESTILRTRDAGRSWTKVGSLNGACGGSFAVTVRSISFPDPQHGWAAIACGRRPMPLYRTSDGGATWNALAVPPNPDDAYAGVSFVNSQTGYAVTEFGHLLRTDDGGATFGPVDSEAVHTPSIKFVTKVLGWEVRGVQLFATMDGGHAWKQMPLGDSVQEFALLPDGRAWVVLGTTASAENANPTRRFLTTRDGGETWLEYQLGAIPSSWRSPSLDSIQFADAQHGWLRGDSGLYYTADDGQNWTQLH